MDALKYRFSALYAAFTETPELAKFRRYLDLWSWILNNEVSDIEKQILACNNIVTDISGVARDRCLLHVTDYHRAYVDEEDPNLKKEVGSLVSLVRQYSEDLRLAHHIANMPEQDELFARHFARYSNLFPNDFYGPTGEHASMYKQVPPAADTCTFKSRVEEDFATDFVLRHLESVNEWLRKLFHRKKSQPGDTSPLPQYISLGAVRTSMHLLAGVYGPLLFAGSLAILSRIESQKHRIVALGFLGLLLTRSLILLIPTLRRSDLFAITAAYFAVGGVYIGANSGGYR